MRSPDTGRSPTSAGFQRGTVAGIALLLMLSLALIVFVIVSRGGWWQQTSIGDAHTQVVEHNGVEVRLIDVQYLADHTVLHFEITPHEVDTIEVDTILPIGPDRIETTGVLGDPEMFGTVGHYPAQGNTQRVEVAVGPVESHLAGAKVQINAIGIHDADGSDGYQWIDGPWSFDLSPDEADITEWITVEVPHEQMAPTLDIYVDVRQVRVSERGVSIDYAIVRAEGIDPLPIGQEVYLELPDGTVVDGDQRVVPGQSASVGGSMLFPPLPEGATSFTIAFGGYVVAERGPVEVSFEIRPGLGSDEARIEYPVEMEFMVDNDVLRVSKLVLSEARGDQPGRGIEVHIDSAMPYGEDTVRFVGPNTKGQVLVDNLGNEYKAAGGSLGFEPDERGVLTSRGTTVIRFDDAALDPLATELTLRTEYYGRIVHGRESMTIDIPGE